MIMRLKNSLNRSSNIWLIVVIVKGNEDITRLEVGGMMIEWVGCHKMGQGTINEYYSS